MGSTGARCYQCGASTTFSMAAASKSLGRLMPSTAPVTYGILSVSCLLYAVSLAATFRETGTLVAPGGMFNIGGIAGDVLQRLGASLPLFIDINQPWRFVTAVFLHGSIMHIGFNMWVLMDIGPQIEEMYGSARYLFIYVVTGIEGGYHPEQLLREVQRRRIGRAIGADWSASGADHGASKHRDANAARATDPLADLHRRVGILVPRKLCGR